MNSGSTCRTRGGLRAWGLGEKVATPGDRSTSSAWGPELLDRNRAATVRSRPIHRIGIIVPGSGRREEKVGSNSGGGRMISQVDGVLSQFG